MAGEPRPAMNVREILHWLVDQFDKPHYERPGRPTAAEVHKHIDSAYGYVAPEPDPAASGG